LIQSNNKDELLVALTFDTDADPEKPLSQPSWDNLTKFNEIFTKLENWFERNTHQKPITTWFVRTDYQVKEVYSSIDGLLNQFSEEWKTVLANHGEIGIHPHMYVQNEEGWRRAETDLEILSQLKDLLSYMKQKYPNIQSSRIGEAFHSNDIMRLLEKYGIKQDSTAMSGRIVATEERIINWEKTPHEPYFPSLEDYRIPGKDQREILEIPMTMLKTLADYDKESYLRYLNPAFHFKSVKDTLSELITKRGYLVSVTHPYELLRGQVKSHGLISYNLDNYLEYLTFFMDKANKVNKSLRFVTISELGEIYRGK